MEWNSYEAIALANVISQNDAYLYRKVCRDYSNKFSTPLHTVYTLPFHFVLIHFMESKIESLSENELRDLSQDIVGIDANEEALIQEQIKKWEEEIISPKQNTKNKITYKVEEKSLDFSGLDYEHETPPAPEE